MKGENPALEGNFRYILADINRFRAKRNSEWTVSIGSAICLFLIPLLRHVNVEISTQFEDELKFKVLRNIW